MPVQPQFNTRSGAVQFMRFAQTLCRLVNLSAPTIKARYPENVALLAAVEAAELVCSLLPAAQAEWAAQEAMSAPDFDPPGDVLFPGQS